MMTRQLFLIGLYFFCCAEFAFAKLPNDNTLVVPSPQNEKTETPTKTEIENVEKYGLIPNGPITVPKEPPTYHLAPGPSVTLALSRAFETSEKDHTGWIGVHVAPWMTATMRTQIGLDIHEDYGWLQAALHSLPTRNLYRLYWGGGLSIVIDSRDELRPLLRLRNYHLFVAGGWELQLLQKQNIRFEASFHQGTEKSFAKATLGYTFLF